MTDWRPSATLQAMHARASLYQYIHRFFNERDVLQVDTPALAHHGVTDVHIECIRVPGYGYLQPSPEYHMKRLLADGSGAIYQISKAFRDGEKGSRHNPEFTLLEWYRPEFSLQQLIDETVELLKPIVQCDAVSQISFQKLFLQQLNIDPLTSSQEQLKNVAEQHGSLPELDKMALVDWLMACVIEPALPKNKITVITDFPEWAAALAQISPNTGGINVAQRFEIYCAGFELANGYLELRDATEQRRRFEQDILTRTKNDQPNMTADPRLIAAMEHGLPACSGVAVGIERVLMAQLNALTIHQILPFPTDIA